MRPHPSINLDSLCHKVGSLRHFQQVYKFLTVSTTLDWELPQPLASHEQPQKEEPLHS